MNFIDDVLFTKINGKLFLIDKTTDIDNAAKKT